MPISSLRPHTLPRRIRVGILSALVALLGVLLTGNAAVAATQVPVSIPYPDGVSSYFRADSFIAFNGKTYFAGDDGNTKLLYEYSGSGKPTVMTPTSETPTPATPGTPLFLASNFSASDITIFDGKLFFPYVAVDQGIFSPVLASLDTSGHMQVYADPASSLTSFPTEVSNLYVWNGSLYFHGYRDSINSFVLKLDPGSTTPMWMDSPSDPNDPSSFMSLNGKLYFSAHSAASNYDYQLFSWDGTNFARHTTGGDAPNWGGLGTVPKYLTSFNNHLYFFGRATSAGPDYALFGFDGTTFEKYTSPLVANAPANPMTVLGTALYLSDGTELWQGVASSSGLSLNLTSLTSNLTNDVRAPIAFGSSVFAPISWQASGSPTFGLSGYSGSSFTNFWTGGEPNHVNFLGVGNGAVFFTAQNNAGDTGLWALAMTAGAPTGLTVTNGNGQVSIAFTPGDPGGLSITNYEYSIDGGTTWVAVNPAATTGPITITGLTNGQSYSIKLRAITDAGNGDASSAVTGLPTGSQPAPTPTPTPTPIPTPIPSENSGSSTLPHTGVKNPLLAGGAALMVIVLSGLSLALRPKRKA